MIKIQSPTSDEIKQAREKTGLTPPKAADLVYLDRTSWTRAEAGKVTMHPGIFELFLIKTGQKTLEQKNKS